MSEPKFIIYNANVIRATEAALLFECDLFLEETWVPKSCVHADSEVFDDGDNSEGTLIIEGWFAKENGWDNL